MARSLVFDKVPVIVAFAMLAVSAHASEVDVDEHPLQPGDRSSPRATLETFLQNAEDYWTKRLQRPPAASSAEAARRAKRCFDLSNVTVTQQEAAATEAAVLLFDVLNRVDLPPLQEIPGADDPKSRERGEWKIPNTPISIVRIDEGPRSGEWLFSSEVVVRAKEMYNRTRHLPHKPGAVVEDGYQLFISSPGNWIAPGWIDELPSPARQVYWEQALWQWAAGAGVLALFLLLCIAALRVLRDSEAGNVRPLLAALSLVLLSGGSLYILDEQVNLTGTVLAVFRIFFYAALFLAAIIATARLGRILGSALARLPRFQSDPLRAGFVALATRLLAGFGIVVLVGLWAYYMGLPVMAVLTGLGVGGIAVALAAQRTLENFIGSMTLFADRPVRIGDRCVFGDQIGNVEHIGLRSTRIRTLERSVITVPNAEFSRLQIENLAERDRRLFRTKLSLYLETSSAQIEQVRSEILELLKGDPRVIGTETRVELIAVGPLSIDLEIFCYIQAREQPQFLAIRRELLLDIIRIIERAGTGLAAPAETHYVREHMPATAEPV